MDDDIPEVGLGGHPKLTGKGGGWLSQTNAALDAWLRKRGLHNERTTPYEVFGEYGAGTSPGSGAEQLPDVEQVPGVGKRQRGERSDDKGNNAARSVRGAGKKSKRKTKKKEG